ncbi:MAG: hypothetical protein GC179_20495 [Anaerolineaceae bacterium]|nr:hypothetical protein [Anaerolineaceae bacterium]
MSPANKTSDGNNLLISLAATMIVGYLSTRFKLFRTLWRFLPLLVVVTAWFLNRQAEEASTTFETQSTTEKVSA